MTDLGKTKKLCPNGHLMDPAWEVCPYCPSDRMPSPELARTLKVDDREPPPAPPAPPAPRRTEIMDRPPSIDGIGWFVGTKDGNQGRMHRIDTERTTLGASGDCDVIVTGDHVSDRHASLRFKAGEFVLTDLDSTNGTFVNGERINQHTLTDGDRVSFGSSEWVFKQVVFQTA